MARPRTRIPEPGGLDFTPIRERLAELGVTQNEYARTLGITPKHVSRVLNGIDTPQARLLAEMARVLGMKWAAVPVPCTYTDRMVKSGQWRLDELARYYETTDLSDVIAAAEWDDEVFTRPIDPSELVRGRGIPKRRVGAVAAEMADTMAAEVEAADDAQRGGL